MRQLTMDQLHALMAERKAPCVSIFQPTHRCHPENKQDPIRYRNLLRDVEHSLREKYSNGDVEPMLRPFQALAHNDRFWNYRTDGLAVLGAGDHFHVIDLLRPLKELAVVADSFHIKPLMRIVQSADRYQILALTRHSAKLYEGNRDALDEVELIETPATITDALGEELTEPHHTVASYGDGSGAPHAAHGEPSMHHGHGSRKDEIDIDMVRFFRAVDRGILKHHSRPSGLPLMLAALTEYHAPFREVSHNPFLLADGIQVNPDALGLDDIRREAWAVLEPHYLKRLAGLIDNYQTAKAKRMGSDALQEITQAAVAGRVGTLLVEADRITPGRITPEGTIEPGDLSNPELDDVLDDLSEMVLRMKGEVVVVPAARMPVTTGAAAVYRF